VTVRELSVLTITEDPNQSRVELHSGKVALRINKALMRPGDVVEIYTPTRSSECVESGGRRS